jgi:hypothetical protein
MTDYEPLDLSAFCHAGCEVFGSGRAPLTGRLTFHGLPFRIGGSEGKPCFLAFGSEPPFRTEPVAIPVGQMARRVIFAHVLQESHLQDGDQPGRLVARYTFILSSGERLEVPIRERFEIGVVPAREGEMLMPVRAGEMSMPFLAVPDHKDDLFGERYRGKWGDTGQRQKEVRQAWPRDYYLWAWENPRPDSVLDQIEILRTDGALPFVIAAITLSHVDEEPFCRTAAVPVELTLLKSEDVSVPFALEVTVDRGVATYPYALPEQPSDVFVYDSLKGWGEKQNLNNSPAYVEIAAIPSASVTVSSDKEVLGTATWGDLETTGVVETEHVRFELVEGGRNWVHTTVLDDETSKPIPCRIHFRSPRGIPYAPHGHHAHVNSNLQSWHIDVGGDVRLGQITYAYIDGKCQGWLPRGEVIVDVARGFEYEPLRTRVRINPGQRELTLRLKRRHHLNAQRYFSGDTHVHFLSTQGALLEAAAENLNVVNLLLSQWGHLFTNSEEFTGSTAVSGGGETVVYASQENRQHMLGHLTLLGLKEPVMPWCSDGPAEAELGGNLEITMSQWADACHAQGGTIVIPHLPNPNGEPAALIATGRADAVEMLRHDPFFHLEYYRYLNGGYRLPLAGGTDKMDSGVPVGLYRTYAYIPPDEPFTYDNWCKALRSGNTFLSSGPLLRFTVNGQPIGSTITLSKNGGTVEVEAVSTSIFPIHTLQVVQGGRVVASTEDARGARELRLRTTLKITRTSWLCARCGGPNYATVAHHDSWRRGIMAHSSPVYVACGSAYELYNPDTMQYMLTLINGSLQYIRRRAPQWRPGTTTHHHGTDDHQAFLEQPFHEAFAAIHKKMHDHGIPH